LKLSDLKIEKQIGAGASAEVYKGTYKEVDVAIKKLRITNMTTDNTLKEFKREVSTLTRVRHPNLVLFMGASADQGHVVIVTEFCSGGTLFSLLHEHRSIELSWR
jgi:serine/threonine protein kinase